MTEHHNRKGQSWENSITDPKDRMVFQALSDPQWEFRTVDGISKDTELSQAKVQEALKSYPNLVRESTVLDRYGRKIFTLRSQPISFRERLATLRMLIAKTVT